MAMYYYVQSGRAGDCPECTDTWTVGCTHDGEWSPDSSYTDRESAAERVRYLNGGITAYQEILLARIADGLENLERTIYTQGVRNG